MMNLDKYKSMFGYITLKKAHSVGFTHYGKYYGIPVWLAPEKNFLVAAKWKPLEHLISIFLQIEVFLRQLHFPHEEFGFQFEIWGKIISETKTEELTKDEINI